MSDERATVARALARIPLLRDADPATAERLAGLTNLNYRIGAYVLRIPGAGTSEYIDRGEEAVAARVAADAGVNVELLFFDDTDGLMVTRFVDGAVTMDAQRFHDLDAVARAAHAFARLHRCGTPFANDFSTFEMIDDYKALLAARDARLPDGYDDLQARATLARPPLERRLLATRVGCHCDPLCENFLDTGAWMYLIDYEYAGNNDPMWDLADLSIEGGFTHEQDAALLDAYFDGSSPADAAPAMTVYKAMVDLLWTLWGVIQHVDENPVDDFWSYAVGRFERCRTIIESPDWPSLVGAI